MAFHTYIGSHSGVYRLAGGKLEHLGLGDYRVSAIHAQSDGSGNDVILAGTYGDGMYRSTDSGATWEAANNGLTASAFRTIQDDPTRPGAILCGAEPARAFRTTDGGVSWQGLDGIKHIEAVPTWYLPYSPRAGALRNFYSPSGEPEYLLGAVEVGGLLSSRDGGATWSITDIVSDDDIHFVTGHPTQADVLYTALGWASLDHDRRREDEPQLGGVARSDDGGSSWRKFHTDYTRAVIVPPADDSLLLAAPAKRVGRLGRIEVSADGGDSWQAADAGLESPMEDMVELFVPAPDDTIWAVCSGGRLLVSEPGPWAWRSPLPEEASLRAEAVSFVNGS
jgi:photosystem II stability/assembly factor-like uncharacterized protein